MAHFAKLDENKVAIDVIVVNNDALDMLNEEASGVSFLTEWSGGHTSWKQTSYSGSFRKNYCGIGYTYDEMRDAFIPPKPYESWIIDEESCLWQAPTSMPIDEKMYRWDESSISWVEIETV